MGDDNLFNFVLTILIIFVFGSLVRYLAPKRRRPKNLAPGPPSLPLIGHLHYLKDPIHRNLLGLSKRYRSPVVSLRFGSLPVVLVSSWAAAEACFTENDVVLANRPKLLLGKVVAYDYTTIINAPYGDHWRNLRRIGSLEIFSIHRLDALSGPRMDEVGRLMRRLSRDSIGVFARVEMKSLLHDLTFNVMTRTIAGKRYCGDDVTDDIEEAREFRDLMSDMTRASTVAYPGDFVPILRWVYRGYEKNAIKLGKRTDRFLQHLVDEARRRKISTRETTNTMVFLVAGSDMVAITLEWALANLMNHRSVLEKAKQEIDSIIGQDRRIVDTDLPKLPYLGNVISETLRLYPASPLLLPRLPSEDCNIGGFHVPRDTIVIFNAWAIHRDPELWRDPESFIPERFESRTGGLGERQKPMLPFGMGRRSCPGAPLARRLVGLTLGSLIQCFDWKRINEEKPVDMTEGPGITMPKAEPLEAMCRARHIMIDTKLS